MCARAHVRVCMYVCVCVKVCMCACVCQHESLCLCKLCACLCCCVRVCGVSWQPHVPVVPGLNGVWTGVTNDKQMLVTGWQLWKRMSPGLLSMAKWPLVAAACCPRPGLSQLLRQVQTQAGLGQQQGAIWPERLRKASRMSLKAQGTGEQAWGCPHREGERLRSREEDLSGEMRLAGL